VDRLTRSDEAGAWSIIDDAVGGGMDPDVVYLELLAPALADVGERWAQGEITIGQEHQASGLVLRLIGRLGPRFARRGRKRGTLVVGAPAGDVHSLPSALLSDLLRGRGFDVIDLGADVPAASWASTCATATNLAGVGIGASTPGNDDAIAAAIAAIRTESSAPIVLGGGAVTDAAHARRLGASSYSATFEDAVDQLGSAGPVDVGEATPRTAS
jgi:methanogenic corrinoid protein MtbC1